ncbi:MAG: TPM domain-containing protein, partial [Vicinamibacteria bacterium]
EAGDTMRFKSFREQLDHERIVAAIREAEKKSRGEIRVHVVRHSVGDVEAAASAAFSKLGMAATAERNGVLLYVAPASQRFAVVGDTAIHERCPGLWRDVATAVERAFREGRFTDGLVEGVAAIGEALEREFPRTPGLSDRNELPDEVSEE